MAMMKNSMAYEAPKAKVYRFDANDQILTSSSTPTAPEPTAEYAANALNNLLGGTNTTIE